MSTATYVGRHRYPTLPWTTHVALVAVCVLLQLLAFWDDLVTGLRRALTDPDAWAFAAVSFGFAVWVALITQGYH